MMNGSFEQLLKNIPVNYPMGVVFLNGIAVEVANFSNLNSETGLAYFVDVEGQIIVLDSSKIDGVAFAEVETDEGDC